MIFHKVETHKKLTVLPLFHHDNRQNNVLLWLCKRAYREEKMLKVNEYFDGNVKSIGFEQKGEKATVGVMEAGDYQFNTAAPERMTVVKGVLRIQLADEDEWHSYHQGESFDVAGHSSFKLEVKTATAYLCEFLD